MPRPEPLPPAPSPSRSPLRRARRAPKTGLLIALAFALIGAGIVLFVFISHKPRPTGAAISPDRVLLGDLPANAGEATDITSVGDTRDARFQIADKKDPNRVSVELLFAKLDPLGAGVYQTTEPRAWVYMKDGRTIYIRADRGRIRRSAGAGGGAAPESGEFSGNGLVLVFPARVAADDAVARPIDPLSDVPGMIGHFDTASFDTVLLEVSSQDPWTVESEDAWASGRGFVVRANQVLERLEFAKISSGGQIRYRMKESAKTEVAADALVGPPEPPIAVEVADESEPGPEATAPLAAASEAPPANPADAVVVGPPAPPLAPVGKEDLYLAEFRDGVTLVQAGRTLKADLLSVWTRFIDNKLPEGALGPDGPSGPERRASTSGSAGAAAPTVSAPMPLPAQLAAVILAQTGTTRRLFSNSDTDVVLTWSGGMVARPLSNPDGEAPAELARGNHVHAKFTSQREGGESRVTVVDTETGAAGVCAALDYAATLRELTLAAGPGCERVDLTVPGAGRFVTPNVWIDMDTGAGRVVGGGTIVQLERDEDPTLVTVRPEHPALADPDAPLTDEMQRRITWTSRADFKFRARKGRMTDALRLAAFEGDVTARDRASWLSGRRLAVEFIQTPRKKSSLSRMKVQGGEEGDGENGPEPAIAIGRSTRLAADAQLPIQDSFIAASEIEVRFAPSKVHPGDDDATRTIASGGVRVGDKRADLRAEWLDAQLIRKSRSDYEAGDVRARGDVRIDMQASLNERESSGAEGGSSVVSAVADEMHADGQARWVDFIGERVELSRGPSAVSGRQMHLQESDGSLQVFGPGAVRHLEISRDASEAARLVLDAASLSPVTDAMDLPPGLTLLEASWSRSMNFTDRTGRIECHGDSTVTSTTSEGGQMARSERLLLDMTPARESRSTSSAAVAPSGADLASGAVAIGASPAAATSESERARSVQADERRLHRAEAIGAVLERDGGQPASVKSWKFASLPPATQPVMAAADADLVGPPPRAPREYDQVMYIEGPRIVVDEVAGMMTIPDAGRGVTFDRGKGSSGTDSLAGGSSGRSQFTWGGTMEFNRITGELKMRRDVELRHLPLDSSELVRMVCNDLTVFFETRGGKGGSATLRTADASGAVYAESGSRHLTADQLSFEAASSTAIARSTSERPVVMQDDRQAAPVLAKALRWETRTDRVDITEPMPVTGAITK